MRKTRIAGESQFQNQIVAEALFVILNYYITEIRFSKENGGVHGGRKSEE